MNLLKIRHSIGSWLEVVLGLNEAQQDKLIATIAIFLFTWLLYMVGSKVFLSRISDHAVHYRWRKTIGYFSTIAAVLLVARLWFPGFQSITTFLGLFSAGLAIAFKDILTDIGGWIFIMYKRPFKVGDRIQVGENAGDVIDINVFQFTLLEIGGDRVQGEQSTGRMIHVPNNKVFTVAVANYTEGFVYIWHEIPIIITFESDMDKAEKILDEIAQKHGGKMAQDAFKAVSTAARKYMIKTSNLGPRVYTSIHDVGVQFTIRYLCTPYNRRETIELISKDILREFSKHVDIDFAYPTTRIFRHDLEGKEALEKSIT